MGAFPPEVRKAENGGTDREPGGKPNIVHEHDDVAKDTDDSNRQ